MICDLAEYYRIYDYTKFSARYIATLVCGLRHGSRVISALSESSLTLTEILLAHIVDNTALNIWAKTTDAASGLNKPTSMLDILTGRIKSAGGFETVDDYEQAKQNILEGN